MRSGLCLVAVAACSGRNPPPAPIPGSVPGAPATPIQEAPEPGSSAIVGFASRTQAIESRHGGEIVTLATTPEGTSVISVDDLGGTRLWPALDGSVEPRVVDLPEAQALAIGPDPRGFVVGAIDASGGLTIAVIDRDGLILQRASLPAEPAFREILMTSRGLLATRSDHSIVRLGSDGSIVERLLVASGQRIDTVASRGDKIVVQIDADKRKLRWLLVAPSLQWGDWVPTKVEPEGTIAVSPRGTAIALVVGVAAQRVAFVVDAATGAIRDRLGVTASTPSDIAFVDDEHLAIGGRAGAYVRPIDRKKSVELTPPAPSPTQHEKDALAAGGARVFGAASAELAIISATSKEYLGYEIEAPTVAAAAPGGDILIGVGSTFALLDKTLATTSTPDFKLPKLASVAELRHVDGNAWLVEWANLDDGRTTAAYIDLATGARQDLRVDREAVHAVGYDARSRLATFALGESNEVFRFDPRTKKFTHLSGSRRNDSTAWQTALTPLAPALADGNEVLVATIGDRLTIRWVRDARSLDKGKAIQLDGTFAAADALGNAYVWVRDTNTFATLILRDGKQVAKLAARRPVSIAPDPAGKRFVEISQHEVALVSHDGTRAWALAAPGVNEVHWLTDGGLALLGTGGLARVDSATGAVQAARCGWRFGLSKTQHRSSSRVEPLCTQLR
ncbi:MAG: hypothetical protein AB7T06_26330 [Kofleriaceae bacterium]